jgi:hypothetical protein
VEELFNEFSCAALIRRNALMDLIESVVIAVALIAVVANMILLVWTSRQVRDQRSETRKLSDLSATLDYRVRRLANAVDQSLQQLQHAIELTSSVYLLMYGRQRDPDVPKMTSADEAQINSCLIELKAIAVVNGDTELIELVGKLRQIVTQMQEGSDPAPTRADIAAATEHVQRKVYELLANATRA